MGRQHGLEPVEPVELPRRLSQSLLARADVCPRSAYLSLKHNGGAGSLDMNRGTGFHRVAERIVNLLRERNESTLMSIVPGEDEEKARGDVASFVHELVRETLDGPEWTPIAASDRDAIRVMAYHLAVGGSVQPERVIGVEKKFFMDIDVAQGHVRGMWKPWTVSGILDVVERESAQTAIITDYKTSLAFPKQETFEKSFQHKLYAAELMFGRPVSKEPCPNGCVAPEPGGVVLVMGDPAKRVSCPLCRDSGRVDALEPSLGAGLGWVRCREVYPRYLGQDGTVLARERILSRTEVTDFVEDLRALVARVDEALRTWVWPAVPGSHCARCPAIQECPIPEAMFTRPIDPTADDIEDIAVYQRFLDEEASFLRDVLKEHAADYGAIPVGSDEEWDFELQPRRETDKAAMNEAMRSGRAVDPEQFVKTAYSTVFRRKKRAA